MISHAYVSVELAQAKARELARRPGLDVTVIAPSRFFEFGRWMEAERPASPEYRLEVLPVALPMCAASATLYFYPRGLVRLMRSLKPDIVDLWEEPYSAVSTQVALARRAVASPRPAGAEPEPAGREAPAAAVPLGRTLVVRDASYVVGRSRESVAVFEAKGYRGPSTVIGHGIELGFLGPRDRAASRRELGLPEDGPVVSFAGRLVPDKGVDVLLDAVALHARPVRALIVGEGPEEPAPSRAGRAAGIADRVCFHAPLPMERVRPPSPPATWSPCRRATSPGDAWRSRPWPAACRWCGGGRAPAGAGRRARRAWCARATPTTSPRALREAIEEPEPARSERVARAREYAASFSWAALAERWEAVYREVAPSNGARPVIRAAFVNHHTGLRRRRDDAADAARAPRSRPRRAGPVDAGRGLLTEGARDLGVEVRVVPVAPSLLGVTRGGAGSPLGSAAPDAPAGRRPAAARAIRAAGADVVVTNSAKAHVYGSLAGRLARRPVVWRIHDTMDSADFAGSTRRLLLAVGRRIPARILTVTDATGRVLVAGGVPPERVTTLYNGIDLAALRADAARAARRDGAPRVGSVGRITPLKGHAVVIEAAARLQERGVDARFVIAGAPSHEAPGHLEELRERAERLGVGERVELISPFPDLAEVLSGLDVMVSASVLPDSLPTTVIASMALGVPVVASELGGGPELCATTRPGSWSRRTTPAASPTPSPRSSPPPSGGPPTAGRRPRTRPPASTLTTSPTPSPATSSGRAKCVQRASCGPAETRLRALAGPSGSRRHRLRRGGPP